MASAVPGGRGRGRRAHGGATTRQQLGLAMNTFIAHPDQWRLLAEQPTLAPQAVEEVMRTTPTAPVTGRVAAEPVTYRGLDIPAGRMVYLITQSANTDPGVYGENTFDITATRPVPQLSFGGGLHYCLGAALTRAELAEALPILARRLPDPVLIGSTRWRPATGITGPVSLPIRFTPTA